MEDAESGLLSHLQRFLLTYDVNICDSSNNTYSLQKRKKKTAFMCLPKQNYRQDFEVYFVHECFIHT